MEQEKKKKAEKTEEKLEQDAGIQEELRWRKKRRVEDGEKNANNKGNKLQSFIFQFLVCSE